MPQDKNRKEIGVGDEVVIHFRVTGFQSSIDPPKPYAEDGGEGHAYAMLETIHEVGDTPTGPFLKPDTFATRAERVILQRKAKTGT